MSVKGHSNQSPRDLGSIELEGKEYLIAVLFKVEETDFDKAFSEQAALYAYLLNETVKAEEIHRIAAAHKELVYAECDEYWREELKGSGRKVTESVIKSAIIRDDEYGRAISREITAKIRYDQLKGIARAWEVRGRMLSSYGAHKRAEIEMTGMGIRDRQYDEISEAKTRLRKKGKKR